MTKLKFTISLSNKADLIITDTTGYISGTNLDGFNPPSTINAANYSLTDGYFMDAILYDKYNDSPVLLNPTSAFQSVETEDPVYALNFDEIKYKLSQDGVFIIKRYFLISEQVYTANKATYSTTASIYYTDGLDVYKSVNSISTKMEREDFVDEITGTFNGLMTSVKFVSTYYMGECYFTILSKLIDNQIKNIKPCAIDKTLVSTKDFLYMTLEVIKHEKKLGNIVEIQRITETLNACGTICKSILPENCGCND